MLGLTKHNKKCFCSYSNLYFRLFMYRYNVQYMYMYMNIHVHVIYTSITCILYNYISKKRTDIRPGMARFFSHVET